MPFNDLFLRAARCEPTERTPIWMMRQAGRYMPEYRAIREKHGFLEMCRTPELAVEVTLQPVDLIGVDAAILFSDILVPFPGMGLDLEFAKGEGPIIHNPVRTVSDVRNLRVADPIEDTGYVMEAIKILRRELEDKVPLIGFAGAPFTLASYMIEGHGTRDYINTKRLMWSEPEAWDRLMTVTSDTVIAYLSAQIDAGAQAVQVFDSWVGYVAPGDYERSVLPYIEAGDRGAFEEGRAGHPLRQSGHVHARSRGAGRRRRRGARLADRHRARHRADRSPTSPSRATSTRSRSSHPTRNSSASWSRSSRRSVPGPGTSSTWATASTRRPIPCKAQELVRLVHEHSERIRSEVSA